MRTHTIAICGSGIAGLASAIALHNRGHHVTLFEKFDAPRPIGSGLMLQPTGQAALARLGLLPATLALARRIDGIQGKTRHGRTIFDIGYDRLGPDSFGLGIHRAALFHVLDAERQRLAIPTVTSVEIKSSSLDGSKRLISSTANLTQGAFDLVIDATGLRSTLRRTLARVTLDAPYAYGAVWGVAREPAGWPSPNALAQRYDGASVMTGVLPMGYLPGDTKPLVAFFWSLRTADLRSWRAASFAAWQDRVAALWPECEPVVRQFQSHADLTPASYADVWLKSPYAERIVFVGDAARAASPQLGQGANLGLIDAVVLADCLSEQPTIADALAAYAKARRAHTRFYGLASRWLTPFFQSDSRLAGLVRDLSFAPMSRIPYLDREMVRTLAGLKTGLFTHQTPRDLVNATSLHTSSPVPALNRT